MPFRTLATAALLLLSTPAIAAPATRPSPAAAPPPPVMFYVAKGAPDACGRDRWIAVEGRINGDAAGRFKKFIKQHLKDRQLPMYFSSPGAISNRRFLSAACCVNCPPWPGWRERS
ncbi:MAG TPA: hypothetical protein VGO49_21220 [Bradyrhizobium sp.]|jgi:hypothetical protein|nr:hypothetical protein [Bradyrhizobium sp.]